MLSVGKIWWVCQELFLHRKILSLHQSNNFGHFYTDNSKNCSKCEHRHCIGHTIGKCGKLHEKPPHSPNIAGAFNDETPVAPQYQLIC